MTTYTVKIDTDYNALGEGGLFAALKWARSAAAGDYLIEYKDTGMTAEQDPGSRCGYDDAQLDEIRHVLGRRGLTLEADDRGLVAAAKSE